MKEVTRLKLHAVRGDRASQEALFKATNDVAREVNKRLRALERRGYNYGAYFTATHFTETMYDTNRFKMPADMDDDWYLMATQTQIGLKFIEKRSSTVEGQREIENERYNSFIEKEIIPEGYSGRKFKNFLRFLGEEETTAMTKSWTDSDRVVEMIFDAYNKVRTTRKGMRNLFQKFLEGKGGTFDETMKKLGIDVNDYRKTKWKNY